MDECGIYVHVNDYFDEELLDGAEEVPMAEAVFLLQSRIEEKVGGMLCIDHFSLPQTRSGYWENEWIIRVNCCCMQQTYGVRTRLDDLFSSEDEL